MKKTSGSESINDVERARQKSREFTAVTGTFRLSKERLAEVGKKGFEQMERIKPSDLGEFSE